VRFDGRPRGRLLIVIYVFFVLTLNTPKSMFMVQSDGEKRPRPRPYQATEASHGQSTHVTSAISTLMTGENATQSTKAIPGVHAKIASALDRSDFKRFAVLFLYDLGGSHEPAA
jgi:hypothetical protein